MIGIEKLVGIFNSFFEKKDVDGNVQDNITAVPDENPGPVPDNKEPIDYGCIDADFPDDMLALEIMKLGYDPANLNRAQMIEMLYERMEQQKPVSEISPNNDSERKLTNL